MISIFDMALLSQYQRYQGYIFTECSLPFEEWFYVENSKSQKKSLAGFSQWATQITHKNIISSQPEHNYPSEK